MSRREGTVRRRAAAVAALVLFATLLLGGCGLFKGPVNASPSLRWWLFSNFGAGRLCPEMLQRSAALRIAPDPNAIGRLFPTSCQTTINDSAQTVTLSFAGNGFAWTPVAGRIAFTVLASVEYRMDFYLADDAVYIYARPARTVLGPTFQVTSVENRLVNWAAQGPAGYLVNSFGSQIVSGELSSGFTVVHADDGDAFALGILNPPARPPQPFNTSKGRYAIVNETSEVHTDQLDFAGPLTVAKSDQALFVRLAVTGPPVDVLLIRRGTGDLWRQGLQNGMALGPPPEAPISTFVLSPGAELRQRFPLPPGQYYLAIDNSARVGSTNPPFSPLGSFGQNTAIVSMAVELGDADDDF
ncbi:MAG TPA: hypothetical protein VMI54_16320 [Polyangiaceae bacterium]|nr:hypothetical protein [Polyangiaceae bacterium]